MFDEEPDGDPHGECAAEINRLTDLLKWSYSKLVYRSFDTLDDALKMDEIKLLLEHGI
jgi:hypothetical protein